MMVIGTGNEQTLLDDSQVLEICAQAFAGKEFDNCRLLCILPDHTRTAPIDMMFRMVYGLLADRVKQLDFLIALGTHPPMSEDKIDQRVGISRSDRLKMYPKARFFNHRWKDPDHLKLIGTLSREEVSSLSGGLMDDEVEIRVNKMVFDYDRLLIIGPTFPHEVVGFSGGNKYLFPGIAGQQILDMFHWLGALITNPVINGNKQTPVRQVIDKAASLIPVERLCASMVVRDEGLAGLFIGSPEEAWSDAADLSARLHIIYKDRVFDRVLSCAPEMYDDLWTGGKCMYKLEPVVADSGELIIYAPHIREISVTHGHLIEKIGYHVRDYFVEQMDRYADIPRGVLAHSTHVKGIGTFENGIEKPRVNVVLATRISRKLCEKINLGYCDFHSIDIDSWKDREEEGILYVPKAGEMLYRSKVNPLS
jgi:nickel-dependent lactate racemase